MFYRFFNFAVVVYSKRPKKGKTSPEVLQLFNFSSSALKTTWWKAIPDAFGEQFIVYTYKSSIQFH